MQETSHPGSFFDDPSKYRWVLFAIVGAIYFLACLHRIAPTIIARDLAQAFDADAVSLGVIASAYFFVYSAVQPPVGVLSDTIGPRRVITIFTATACLGGLVFATAANEVTATLGRALIGAGVGGIFIPTLKLFSRWYKANEFASLTGVFLAIGNLGNLSAALPLTYLVLFLGWRMSFMAVGVLSLFLALICWIIVRDKPEDKGWAPVKDAAVEEQAAAAAPDNIRTLKRLAIVLRKPSFWMITISCFFGGGAGLSFQGLWAVPYLIDIHELSRVKAGSVLMLIPLGFTIGAPVFGFLTDKLGLSRKPVLLTTLGLTISCWIIFIIFGAKASLGLIIPLFLIMGFCGGGGLPLYMTITKELFPPWLTGTAVGLMNPSAFLATALYQPFTGYLLDRVGLLASGGYPLKAYQHIFIVFLISYILAFLIAMMISVAKPQRA
ncbi:MAG: MFS transporter [Deltaproteobacteria bacterium]|nr:MFS transporter [Deltaproteobacteria bacterium]